MIVVGMVRDLDYLEIFSGNIEINSLVELVVEVVGGESVESVVSDG